MYKMYKSFLVVLFFSLFLAFMFPLPVSRFFSAGIHNLQLFPVSFLIAIMWKNYVNSIRVGSAHVKYYLLWKINYHIVCMRNVSKCYTTWLTLTVNLSINRVYLDFICIRKWSINHWPFEYLIGWRRPSTIQAKSENHNSRKLKRKHGIVMTAANHNGIKYRNLTR